MTTRNNHHGEILFILETLLVNYFSHTHTDVNDMYNQ